MATLVLSTVGTMLGGPVGGAIGSLVGQSIDQQIFASPRRGPRLGDLSVQTSSYGTQVPRVYGTMRIAGSVIWATDLVESTQTSGAKGQPDETYSYSISFAVALSSRPLREIRRIWADGKLLRGEGGDFKVSTDFRFHDGGEGQEIDPLIASVEGIEAAPAYRGLALAVFENLELAEFGNRIPFLTFEVVADVGLTLGGVLNDVSRGIIASDTAEPIEGYAATGSSISAAIQPLVDAFAVDLDDDGWKLSFSPSGPSAEVREEDLGCSIDAKFAARVEREQASARAAPSSVQLSFYDPERDFQAGQSRSDIVDRSANEERIDLAAVLSATDARSLAEQLMARRWAHRDKLIVRLPPKFMGLRPGSTIEIPRIAGRWQVVRATIDGMISMLELRPSWRSQVAIDGEAGRALPANDVVIGDVAMALVELPAFGGGSTINPTLYLAASAPGPSWKRLPVEVSYDGFSVGSRTAYRKSVMGHASTVLAASSADTLDTTSSVEVELIDPTHWLTSCSDEALDAAANLALIGDELIQFADAEPVGPARFRLTQLRRGRFATGWSVGSHAEGDLFLLIDPASLQAVRLPPAARGKVVTASLRSTGVTVSASRSVDGRSLPIALYVDGEQVVGSRAAAIADPIGGAVVDGEARSSLAQILDTLRGHGLIET